MEPTVLSIMQVPVFAAAAKNKIPFYANLYFCLLQNSGHKPFPLPAHKPTL